MTTIGKNRFFISKKILPDSPHRPANIPHLSATNRQKNIKHPHLKKMRQIVAKIPESVS